MITLHIRKQLRFSTGQKVMLVDIFLQENSITALYGESGAGKTTLLKIIAGLITPEEGYIKVNDVVWLDTKQNINLPPQQRNIGFVFQDYALFPNMTVLQNLRYAVGNPRNESFIDELVDIVSLRPFLEVKPAQLSGGQQQRVALIRALVCKPRLLLLDEPLSALDAPTRHSLHNTLRRLQKQLEFTAMLVSHDIGEVYSLSQNVVQLHDGNVVFEGTPQQLFGSGLLSNKLQLTGEILSIIPNGVVYIVEVLVGISLVKLTATAGELNGLSIGNKVLIYTKAFHISIKRIRKIS